MKLLLRNAIESAGGVDSISFPHLKEAARKLIQQDAADAKRLEGKTARLARAAATAERNAQAANDVHATMDGMHTTAPMASECIDYIESHDKSYIDVLRILLYCCTFDSLRLNDILISCGYCCTAAHLRDSR